MTRHLDPRDTDPLHVDERVPSHQPAPAARPLGGCELLVAGVLFVLAILAAIVAASAPRSAATAIPTDDAKGNGAAALASSGNPSLPSEAPTVSDSQLHSVIPSVGIQQSDGGGISGGLATWYADGAGYYAAVPSWHWHDRTYRVKVCLTDRSRCVYAVVRDFCACKGARSIDLSPAAFRRLAPLARGVVPVMVVGP